MNAQHTFHIPVMGIGYTVDTPVKVSHLGIHSVISLVDDELMEKLREMYSADYQIDFTPVDVSDPNFRALRITRYLNTVNEICERKFNDLVHLRNEDELTKLFRILPSNSSLASDYKQFIDSNPSKEDLSLWLSQHLQKGSIDVNIMTKIDKENYSDDQSILPAIYNDAQAALRGYAESELESSLVFSAGMNPAIYAYAEQFKDFYPDEHGFIRKKLIIKVSDFRSALIQGKYFAKKGIWVSEYRIESGLNCGGHAFATDGLLMGPIMAEFRDRREELYNTVHEMFIQGLSLKNMTIPSSPMKLRISAQGGISTFEEQEFVMKHYLIDSVGWGSPFLLVPEVTAIDDDTVDLLAKAGENELYLSGISPMGVAFNNVRNNTKDLEKEERIIKGVPGSPCTKNYISFNKEFTPRGICMASRQYQRLKIEELDKQHLSEEEYQAAYKTIVERACICVGLGTAALLKYNLDTHPGGNGVAVCPGPNLAYFNKKMNLVEITDHIYGRTQLVSDNRPHFLIKELALYLHYIDMRISEKLSGKSILSDNYINNFLKNMLNGIAYYFSVFTSENGFSELQLPNIKAELNKAADRIHAYLHQMQLLHA